MRDSELSEAKEEPSLAEDDSLCKGMALLIFPSMEALQRDDQEKDLNKKLHQFPKERYLLTYSVTMERTLLCETVKSTQIPYSLG